MSIGPVVSRRSVIAIATSIVAFVVFALAVLPSTADAASYFRYEVKTLKGSKGYKVYIGGGNQYSHVAFDNSKKGLSADYQATVSNSKKKVGGKFGKAGSFKLKFKKTGKPKPIPLPKNCKGTPGKFQPGVFKGKIKLKGEENFSKLNVGKGKKLKGRLILREYVVKKCKPGKSPGETPDYANIELTRSIDLGGGKWLSASYIASRKDNAGSKTSVFAITTEYHGKYFVNRVAVKTKRPASALQYTKPFSTATTTPSISPFRGSATINQPNNAIPSGDLEVDFPGRSGFGFTGAGTIGSFYIQSFQPLSAVDLRDPAEIAGTWNKAAG